MNDIWERVTTRLTAGQSVVRAAVVTQEGSAPRTAGASMLVFADGGSAGTVGGGLVEARVLEAAAEVLESGAPRIMDFNLTGEAAAGADMICGGRLDVFLERLDPDMAGLFAVLTGRVSAGERCLLATPLEPGSDRVLFSADGRRIGVVGSGGSGGSVDAACRTLARAGADIHAPVCLEADGTRYFLEPCQGRPRVFLIGAGHVARATAQAAALAGYAVIVLDDRPDFASPERFPTAAQVAVVPSLDDCFAGRTITSRDLVVIVTRGHLHDASVLAQALGTPAGYVGMIGSRRKRDAIYDRLLASGLTRADLDRVHAPVGLDIGAETPEEIAISIVAELIASRVGKS
ncbi:MAG: XdhC family aldehyde oxidoreductase maturation factor [Thermodesulfobacteriota bacterium]